MSRERIYVLQQRGDCEMNDGLCDNMSTFGLMLYMRVEAAATELLRTLDTGMQTPSMNR